MGHQGKSECLGIGGQLAALWADEAPVPQKDLAATLGHLILVENEAMDQLYLAVKLDQFLGFPEPAFAIGRDARRTDKAQRLDDHGQGRPKRRYCRRRNPLAPTPEAPGVQRLGPYGARHGDRAAPQVFAGRLCTLVVVSAEQEKRRAGKGIPPTLFEASASRDSARNRRKANDLIPMPLSRQAAARLGPRSRVFLRHILEKIGALTLGALFVSRPGQRLWALAVRWRTPVKPPHVRTAILAHAYYVDLIPEILACRASLHGYVPVHLTVPAERVQEALQVVGDALDVTIHACENRGRDIAPFLSILNSGLLDPFDAVLKLHTKRSPHLLDGEIRRKMLFAMLCGSKNSTSRALAAFEDPTTGMVGWAASYRTAPPYWMLNETRVRAIASRIHAPADTIRLGFFEGSMFWFRPAALAALRELAFLPEDFEQEARQLDGTLHHAIERCFTIAARASGYAVCDLRGRILQ